MSADGVHGRPGFLVRLDLGADADERAVRRAYARELKKIDQAADLEGFQHLRDCYEAALAWVAQDGPPPGVETPGTVPAPAAQDRIGEPEPEPEPESEPPSVAARAVLASFRAQWATWVPLYGANDTPEGVATCADLLREAGADPRLLPLNTRAAFECMLAELLVAGWRPGHHLLLAAAIEVYRWNEDWQELAHLGDAGAKLWTVLDDLAAFRNQPGAARERQAKLLTLLRHTASYDALTQEEKNALFDFHTHFGTLLAVLVPPAVVPRYAGDWLYPASTASAAGAYDLHAEVAMRKRIVSAFYMFVFGLVVLPALVLALLSRLMP